MENNVEIRWLSVRQPYAWAIIANLNTFENRVWNTQFRGTIALHAATSTAKLNAFRKDSGVGQFSEEYFSLGAIKGIVDIVDVRPYGPQDEADPFAIGPYCWKMANGRMLKSPVPIKGKPNLFKLDPAIAEIVSTTETYQLDLQELHFRD